MLALTSRGTIFVALNVIRVFSFVSLLLVWAAIVVLMVQDSRAYQSLKQSGELADADESCDYLPYSDIPTTTWGLFWVQFHRALLLMLCLLCAAAEVSAGLLDRILNSYVPILGTRFSTLPLGIIEILVSTSVLSQYLSGYPLVPPWLLFFAGLFNITVGIAFGRNVKLRRSIFRTQRDLSVKEEQSTYDRSIHSHKDVEKGSTSKAADVLRTLTHTKLGDAIDRVSNSKKARSFGPRVRRIARPSEAFKSGPYMAVSAADLQKQKQQGGAAVIATGSQRPGHARDLSRSTYASATYAHSAAACSIHSADTTPEMLRQRARLENWRAEREQERRDGGNADPLRPGHETFGLHRRTPSQDIESLNGHIDAARVGASCDLSTDFYPVARNAAAAGSTSKQWHANLASDDVPATGVSPFQTALRRRTLVLSKMVQQVKRGSASAAKRCRGCRRVRNGEANERVPSLPSDGGIPTHGASRLKRGLMPPGGGPGPWIEVDRTEGPPQPPEASYAQERQMHLAPGAYRSDEFHSRSEYHSILPIASRYAHT